MNQYSSLGEPDLVARSRSAIGRLPLARRLSAARGAFVRPFLFFITAVAAAAGLYYFVLAAPLYTSDAQIAVRGKQALTTNTIFAAALGAQQPGVMESTAVVSYMDSLGMLKKLDASQNLRAQYTRFRPDFLYHLPAGSSQHRFLRFYRGMMEARYDSASGIVSLQVQAFEPQAARDTAAAILANSEEFVGNLSRQMLSESTRAALQDVAEAKVEAVKAHAALAAFQGRNNRLDPNAYGIASNSAYFQLDSEIAKLRAQLASLRTYSTAQSPQVQQVNAQIANLVAEQRRVQARMTGAGAGGTVVSQLGTFQRLQLDQQYADQRLTVAQSALDQARSVGQQRQLFIVPITGPNLPDEPTPRRWWGFLTALAIASSLYVVGRLTLASIRDHQI